jgi:hypothetical protein
MRIIRVIKQVISYFCLFFYQTSFAAPPFITDDPAPVEYKHWETYYFAAVDKTNASTDYNLPGIEINYGLLSNLEVNLTFSYALTIPHTSNSSGTASGISDTEIGLKYLFIKETDTRPQVAFAPAICLPTGNANRSLGNGRTWEIFPIWLQKSWGSWTSYGGGGYAINSAPGMLNYFFGGCVLQRQINTNWMLGGEIFSQGADSSSTSSFTLINMGGSYNFTENLSILFSVGHSVVGEDNLVSYAALNWNI